MRWLLTALAVTLATVAAASAHGPEDGGTGYVSTVSGLRPNVVGVFVTVLGGDDRLQLTNYSGALVEVLADIGLLRPRWLTIAPGRSRAWHEHRIHWEGEQPPPAVQRDPAHDHRIVSWRVPARADGKPFVIKGFLGYRPGVSAHRASRPPAWGIALLATGLAVAAAAAGLGARRVRRRAP